MESIFQLNQIVWAKINGYPWWPAYVKAEVKSSQYEVVFFGDFSRAILHLSKIRTFDELGGKVNGKNKVLNVALRSAERIMSGESTIVDEWNKIDRSALAPAQSNKPAKKPTKKSKGAEDEPSLCLSNTSRAKCQESDTKVEADDAPEYKCSNSLANNLTSSTYNHFIEQQEEEICDEPAFVEERIEDLYANLRSDEYKTEAGVRAIHEVTGRTTALEPKLVFASNIGVLLSNCISVCRAKLPLRPYRLTLELLSDCLSKICDYLIKEGFLMENKVSHDYIDLSKRNSMITEFFPDLTSPGIFDTDMSPVKQRRESETQSEQIPELHITKQSDVEVEARVQFRVKRKLAKLMYREENRDKVKKRVCEQMATQVELSIRNKARTLSDYKESVLALVKIFEKDVHRASEMVVGFQNGKRIDALLKELNKLTGC